MIIIEPRQSFQCPSGVFNARLYDSKTRLNDRNEPTEIRLIFKVEVPDATEVVYLAGKTYRGPFTRGSKLLADLNTWLGGDYLDSLAGTAWKPEMEIGRPAQLILEHIISDQHKHPFVDVAGIYKPGTAPLGGERLEEAA